AARDLLEDQIRAPADGVTSPWDYRDGWQANAAGGIRYKLRDSKNNEAEIFIQGRKGYYTVTSGSEQHSMHAVLKDDERLALEIDGVQSQLRVRKCNENYMVQSGSHAVELTRINPYATAGAGADSEAHPGSPMPGRIVAVHVKIGDTVEPGQPLLVLEGMKMEYTLKATVKGTVEKVLYNQGDMIDAEVPLVDIAPAEAS
ncbi:MAG: biotin/lipoyl-binding protein, partial [Gammaproteobacteria bacterium]|nr:biotin/lipoyl-binding protein [Gammaproteobacteria bacterium]